MIAIYTEKQLDPSTAGLASEAGGRGLLDACVQAAKKNFRQFFFSCATGYSESTKTKGDMRFVVSWITL